jgi:hypothetical protein
MEDLKIKTSLLADNVIIDQQGKASILGVFDTINSSTIPALHSVFNLILIIKGKAGNYQEKAKIKSPEGTTLLESEWAKFKLNDSTNSRAQIINEFRNILLPAKGEYKIEIYIDSLEKPFAEEKFFVLPLSS